MAAGEENENEQKRPREGERMRRGFNYLRDGQGKSVVASYLDARSLTQEPEMDGQTVHDGGGGRGGDDGGVLAEAQCPPSFFAPSLPSGNFE